CNHVLLFTPGQFDFAFSRAFLRSSRTSEMTADGHHALAQLENTTTLGYVSPKSGNISTIARGLATIQIGPANLLSPPGHRDAAVEEDHGPGDASNPRSLPSRFSSKFGFQKRLSRLFKGDPKVKEIVLASPASSAPITLVKTEGRIQSTSPDRNALPVLLKLHSPLLTEVQEIPKLEYDLHVLRMVRIAEYKQAVYIDPMAKLTLQDTDEDMFPLMDRVRDFLAGDTQVMLVLGDSGAGKSTFNRYLEHKLWQEYKPGGRIPLFVNLPSLERPEKDLVAEQLRTYDFTGDQIRGLKKHRQLILICDGYDESQLTSNLHTTNLFNRSGQ
ncbi:hypothetical protein BGZ88_005282, partial [Linnemannia elongata]